MNKQFKEQQYQSVLDYRNQSFGFNITYITCVLIKLKHEQTLL